MVERSREGVERVAAVNHGLEAPSGLGLEPHSARGSSDRSRPSPTISSSPPWPAPDYGLKDDHLYR